MSAWLALAAGASVGLWHLRREVLDSQARELAVLSLALTDEIARGLQGAEEGLHAVRKELQDGQLPASGPAMQRALRTRADLMPMVQTLWLVDAGGRLLSASDATPVPDRATFAPPLDGLASDVTAVSRPFEDANAHQSRVALAVRFDGMQGATRGWILGGVPATAFLGAFSAARPAPDARMAVFRSDGVLLAAANVGAPRLDEASVTQRLASRPTTELRQFSDGSQKLVGLHSVPRYDLKVVVTRNLQGVLESWQGAAQLTAGAFALLLGIMAASVHLVLRAEHRRTEAQHALQTQLARAGRLESLGRLAGGVAHDFNNVLAGIVGFGEMAQDAATPGSDQARHLDKVLQAALRGKALVEHILAFSRGGARASTVFELEPVVEEVLTLLSASLRPGMVLERELEAQGARLRGDPTQVFEAIMNLCTNAMQAMPEGGMLSVRLERTHAVAARVLSHALLQPGHYLALSVSDQGLGIAPDVMEHLFEPFFTTRDAQSGTGLGLAVVHGVVAEFGGAIDVQSNPGQGARFTLYLPECTDAPVAAASLPDLAPRGAGQRILVVDDESDLVAMVVEMLEGLGYAPVGFTDPDAVLQALRDDPSAFAAVVTDEVMPRLSGTQLTEALRRHAPHLPVLLVSGYGGALLAQRAADAGVTRVLTKPLRRGDLAGALAELLR